jgi:hypothetical protein
MSTPQSTWPPRPPEPPWRPDTPEPPVPPRTPWLPPPAPPAPGPVSASASLVLGGVEARGYGLVDGGPRR